MSIFRQSIKNQIDTLFRKYTISNEEEVTTTIDNIVKCVSKSLISSALVIMRQKKVLSLNWEVVNAAVQIEFAGTLRKYLRERAYRNIENWERGEDIRIITQPQVVLSYIKPILDSSKVMLVSKEYQGPESVRLYEDVSIYLATVVDYLITILLDAMTKEGSSNLSIKHLLENLKTDRELAMLVLMCAKKIC
jgi:hypothetical protein